MEKLYNNENNDVKVKALWITMLSGRSINQFDPNPNEEKFYYFYDNVNDCNIKVAKWDEDSFWFPGDFIGAPKENEGQPGDFYEDNLGDIYIKVDQYFIDHLNSDPSDNRRCNLREIICSSNSSNRVKSENYSNKYTGVVERNKRFQGKYMFKGKNYFATFGTGLEAAKFHDYYLLALNGIEISNNGTLSQTEKEDLFLNGVKAIPENFLAKKKDSGFPKGLCFIKINIIYEDVMGIMK